MWKAVRLPWRLSRTPRAGPATLVVRAPYSSATSTPTHRHKGTPLGDAEKQPYYATSFSMAVGTRAAAQTAHDTPETR